ncbi:MAG: tyrosine-type recombinase/integrase [Patescibacteria group bacterium]|nr:tyrosine-type recombinase/integrase [Patescibacteria group bacterium]
MSLSAERIELARVPERELDLISFADLERLLRSPDGSDVKALRDRALLELLFSTGLRVSELCALNHDLDLTRDTFSVRGKGEKIRVVFLSETARIALRAYLGKRTDLAEPLFVSFSPASKNVAPRRLTSRSVERIVKHFATKSGISKKVTPHTMRHVFATDLLENGADIRSVQALLGHAHLATTQIYTHVTDTHLRDVHKAFHGKRRSR